MSGPIRRKSRYVLVLLAALAASLLPAATAHAVDTVPPVVTISPSAVLSANQKVTFNEPVIGVTAENVAFHFENATANVPAGRRCLGAGNAVVSCSTGEVRVVEIDPATPLIAGQMYVIAVNPAGATPVTDLAANPAPSTSKRFLGSVVEEEASAGARYDWRAFADSRAIGGIYHSETQPGARALFYFSGTEVYWYTKLGPDQGTATITIDGVYKGVVNNYRSSVLLPGVRWWKGLPAGNHTLAIIVRGQKGSSAGTGTWVTVDGVRAGSGPIVSPFLRWQGVSNAAAFGNAYVRTRTGGSRVTFPFRGSGIDWFMINGPAEGKANIYIDGKFNRTIDNYAVKQLFRARKTITGLSDAVHTLTIIAAGTKNPASSGTTIAVDRFVLKASTNAFRKLGAWVDLFDIPSSALDTEAEVQAAIADMDSHGVKTLYLQTGRYNTNTFAYPTQTGWWLRYAHEAGIAVIGWYLPAYSEYLAADVTKTAAIGSFVAPGNHRFDGLAIDIEYRVKNDSKTEFFNGISSHLAQVRSRVGLVFPVGAITFSPQDMDRWHAGWDGFPWNSVAAYANAALPMNYWSVSSNRNLCSGGNANYCPYGFTKQNILRTRAATGLLVHAIGGVGNAGLTPAEIAQYVQASKDTRAYGGSLYDYRTTAASFWAPLAGLNSL